MEFHVIPGGDDRNPGTREQPFATVERARDAVRAWGRAGSETVTVHLGPGVYYLAETLVLEARDSGSAEAPVTYAGAEGGAAVLSGGRKLALSWTPCTELHGLPAAEAGRVSQARTPPGTAIDQLFVNGPAQHGPLPELRSRRAALQRRGRRRLQPGARRAVGRPGRRLSSTPCTAPTGAATTTGSPARTPTATSPTRAAGRTTARWACTRSTASWRTSSRNSTRPASGSTTRKTQTLYYYPADRRRPGKRHASRSSGLRHLVEFRGTPEKPVRHITLRGFTFRHAARTFMEIKEPLLRSDWTHLPRRRGAVRRRRGLHDRRLRLRPGRRQRGLRQQLQPPHHDHAAATSTTPAPAASASSAIPGRSAIRCSSTASASATADIDQTPGPKTDNYPADCLVDDCLIHDIGRGREAGRRRADLDVRGHHRPPLLDLRRAAGRASTSARARFGGHLIEFCDVFDTVRETGDHGRFNSWGRDRFWQLEGRARRTSCPNSPCSTRRRRPSSATAAGVATTAGTSTSTTARSTTEIYNNLCLQRRHQAPRGVPPHGLEQHHGQQLAPPARLVSRTAGTWSPATSGCGRYRPSGCPGRRGESNRPQPVPHRGGA